jgi:hypothetical protein
VGSPPPTAGSPSQPAANGAQLVEAIAVSPLAIARDLLTKLETAMVTADGAYDEITAENKRPKEENGNLRTSIDMLKMKIRELETTPTSMTDQRDDLLVDFMASHDSIDLDTMQALKVRCSLLLAHVAHSWVALTCLCWFSSAQK